MPKIGSIDFDNKIISAIENDKLVIFAGAGVSMGDPAKMPDFKKLAELIATGHKIKLKEKSVDRFLGELISQRVNVHDIAAEILKTEEKLYTNLHANIIKIFKTLENIRIVTTNYDHLFEQACSDIHANIPIIYQAPALPLGNNFKGIVHVHGDINKPDDMVLTDIDFGRGYLTEGWARRFLVELFRNYTVLFIGYSHSDTILQYLVRAIVSKNESELYILTKEDLPEKWDSLGIKPILFTGENFEEQDRAVELLAARINRGNFDWKKRVFEICSSMPPLDEETISEVDYILSKPYTTKFFVESIRSHDWLLWLDQNNYINALFNDNELDENELLLCDLIADYALSSYSHIVLDIFVKHNHSLNFKLWNSISLKITNIDEEELDVSILRYWVPIILDEADKIIQKNRIDYVLFGLAKRCYEFEELDLVILIFLNLIKIENKFTENFNDYFKYSARTSNWHVNEIWSNYLKNNLDICANQIVLYLSSQFTTSYKKYNFWNIDNKFPDPLFFKRRAIEDHEQNNLQNSISIHIDILRDSFDYLSVNFPDIWKGWIKYFLETKYSLFIRIAIYSMSQYSLENSDEKLNWLLNNIDIFRSSEHHEVFEFLKNNYKDSFDNTRRALVNRITDYKVYEENGMVSEEKTKNKHFNWLMWLLETKHDCNYVVAALKAINEEFPNFKVRTNPNFLIYLSSGDWSVDQSPWTIEEILFFDIGEKLNDYLNFQEDSPFKPNRNGLLNNIKVVAKQNPEWSFKMAETLIERKEFITDIWDSLFEGWELFDVNSDTIIKVLLLIDNENLLSKHYSNCSNFILRIIENNSIVDISNKLISLTTSIWEIIDTQEFESITDWLTRAFNEPSGKIVLSWLKILSQLMKDKRAGNRYLPNEFKNLFEIVINDETAKGDCGRCILASQFTFLSSLDKKWTISNVYKMFLQEDKKLFQQVWNGFLYWGIIDSNIADDMFLAFKYAINNLDKLSKDEREKFVEKLTILSMYYIESPLEEFIFQLLSVANIDERVILIETIKIILNQMEPAAKKKLWDDWLYNFLIKRINNIPIELEDKEIQPIFEWLPYLDNLYPNTIEILTKLKPISFENTFLLYSLKDSDLVIQYQESTAKLIIWLADSLPKYDYDDLSIIVEKLTDIGNEIKNQLQEKLLGKGINFTLH